MLLPLLALLARGFGHVSEATVMHGLSFLPSFLPSLSITFPVQGAARAAQVATTHRGKTIGIRRAVDPLIHRVAQCKQWQELGRNCPFFLAPTALGSRRIWCGRSLKSTQGVCCPPILDWPAWTLFLSSRGTVEKDSRQSTRRRCVVLTLTFGLPLVLTRGPSFAWRSLARIVIGPGKK